mmetsp:Transcript_173197/g.421286  ORF Transcript_173197/g.421286 Transcript_173197/m.421286 type:complete len:315 (+) Transcript_173197:273-1217(+)
MTLPRPRRAPLEVVREVVGRRLAERRCGLLLAAVVEKLLGRHPTAVWPPSPRGRPRPARHPQRARATCRVDRPVRQRHHVRDGTRSPSPAPARHLAQQLRPGPDRVACEAHHSNKDRLLRAVSLLLQAGRLLQASRLLTLPGPSCLSPREQNDLLHGANNQKHRAERPLARISWRHEEDAHSAPHSRRPVRRDEAHGRDGLCVHGAAIEHLHPHALRPQLRLLVRRHTSQCLQRRLLLALHAAHEVHPQDGIANVIAAAHVLLHLLGEQVHRVLEVPGLEIAQHQQRQRQALRRQAAARLSPGRDQQQARPQRG